MEELTTIPKQPIMPQPVMNVILVRPRGFCAGVERAILMVDLTLQRYGSPVYVRHEIVHNAAVIESFRAKGVVFVDELDDIPPEHHDRPVIFSAHGVAQRVRRHAGQLALNTIDATCPLVTKVHNEVIRAVHQGLHVVFVGHRDHPESHGTVGQVPDGCVTIVETVDDARSVQVPDDKPLMVTTQTTLSIFDTTPVLDALKKRFPRMNEPSRQDICFATENRQRALVEVAPTVQACIVLGSANSSNTRRLEELAIKLTRCKMAWRVDAPSELPIETLRDLDSLAITAGASAPEELVEQTMDFLSEHFWVQSREAVVIDEHVRFSIPAALRGEAR